MDFFSRLLLSGNTIVAACPTAQINLFAPLAAEGPEGICLRGCVFFAYWALHGCDLKDERLRTTPTPENLKLDESCIADPKLETLNRTGPKLGVQFEISSFESAMQDSSDFKIPLSLPW
jgi:hypothetical protein